MDLLSHVHSFVTFMCVFFFKLLPTFIFKQLNREMFIGHKVLQTV